MTALRVPTFKPSDLVVEASPRRVYANAHTYHINSISLNSDDETYLSADDLRINLWHLGINDQSYSILFCLVLVPNIHVEKGIVLNFFCPSQKSYMYCSSQLVPLPLFSVESVITCSLQRLVILSRCLLSTVSHFHQ